jgi:hypothetical protein
MGGVFATVTFACEGTALRFTVSKLMFHASLNGPGIGMSLKHIVTKCGGVERKTAALWLHRTRNCEDGL